MEREKPISTLTIRFFQDQVIRIFTHAINDIVRLFLQQLGPLIIVRCQGFFQLFLTDPRVSF